MCEIIALKWLFVLLQYMAVPQFHFANVASADTDSLVFVLSRS